MSWNWRPGSSGSSGCAWRPNPSGEPQRFGRGFAAVVADRRSEADRFYEELNAADLNANPAAVDCDEARRVSAAGLRGSPVVQAVLPLRRFGLAGGRSRTAAAAAGAVGHGPQPRLAAGVRAGRDFDARQVGVPVVRLLGPGLSHDPVCAGRPGVRQAAAEPAAAGVVHAPQRADSGLRMEFFRRKSARARLGRLAGLQDDRSARRPRPAVPGAGLPEAADEFHLVGESQGSQRPAHLQRRLPRAWTTSGSSTGPSRCRTAARSSRPTAPPGWPFIAAPCCRSRSNWRSTIRPTRTSPRNSSSTSWRSPTP